MTRLRYLTAGESHGKGLVGILEGMPAGLPVSPSYIAAELARRRSGHGRGPRMSFEADSFEILSGMRGGATLGTPIGIVIQNSEWAKWQHMMDPFEVTSSKTLTRPRPGHADLPGMLKYGTDDARDILERASARETAVRVAIASFAKTLLARLGISVLSHTVRIGEAAATGSIAPLPGDLERIDTSPVRCADPAVSEAMVKAIDEAAADGDSLGGIVEVLVHGLPPGLGSHVHWDRKLDGRLAAALMSVPAIKGVELGDGFSLGERRGSLAHDEIGPGLQRATIRSGGTEGGMSTGGVLTARAVMKPLSTLKKRLATVDMSTGEAAEAFQERTDVCAVPAAGVVCEAVVALTIAGTVMEDLGGATVDELTQRFDSYLDRLEARGYEVTRRPV